MAPLTKNIFGPALPQLDWVPAPRYIFRRLLILEYLSGCVPGSVLEIGYGSGALLCDLAERGFAPAGVETSPAARLLAQTMLAQTPDIRLFESIDNVTEQFDFLLAFEVLEHIEDDRGALAEWLVRLKPGGTILLSVPAHPKKWDASDEYAGHFRRYSRQGLSQLIDAAGCDVELLIAYGFPLLNVTDVVRAAVYSRRMRQEASHSIQARTERSGIDRRTENRLFPLYSSRLGSVLLRGFFKLQRPFFATDWGTGFFLAAKKRH